MSFGDTIEFSNGKTVAAKERIELAEAILSSALVKVENLGVSVLVSDGTNGGRTGNKIVLNPGKLTYRHGDLH